MLCLTFLFVFRLIILEVFIMITRVVKRDGRAASFNIEKIANAVYKALEVSGEGNEASVSSRQLLSMDLASKVAEYLELTADTVPNIEEIQDMVEKVLIEANYP